MKIDEEVIEGIFIEEGKNRFISKVAIANEVCECYIPSSSKLENYIKLKNKKVLLVKNKGTNQRTKYSVFAVKSYNKYVILNLGYVNKIIENEILEGRIYRDIDTFKKEFKIGDYKADFFIPDNELGTVIEAKGMIGIRKLSKFPTVYSERAIEQLEKIESMLCEGYKVDYYIVSLSPIIKEIAINREFTKFYNIMNSCMMKGMRVYALTINIQDNQINIAKNTEVIF